MGVVPYQKIVSRRRRGRRRRGKGAGARAFVVHRPTSKTLPSLSTPSALGPRTREEAGRFACC